MTRHARSWVAGYGKVEAVELLCDEAGAAVDAGAGTEHGTALMRAARFGHAPAVQALLARRADPRATDCQGAHPTSQRHVFFERTRPLCVHARRGCV